MFRSPRCFFFVQAGGLCFFLVSFFGRRTRFFFGVCVCVCPRKRSGSLFDPFWDTAIVFCFSSGVSVEESRLDPLWLRFAVKKRRSTPLDKPGFRLLFCVCRIQPRAPKTMAGCCAPPGCSSGETFLFVVSGSGRQEGIDPQVKEKANALLKQRGVSQQAQRAQCGWFNQNGLKMVDPPP